VGEGKERSGFPQRVGLLWVWGRWEEGWKQTQRKKLTKVGGNKGKGGERGNTWRVEAGWVG